MASSRFTNKGVDFSNNFINIDTLIDVLSAAQKSEGVTPTFQLSLIDQQGNKTRHVDNTEVTVDKEEKKSTCNGCKAPCGKSKQGPDDFDWNILMSPLGSSDYDDEDDGEPYICEFCDSLGYNQKYKPDICDKCSVCESCEQYENECDGCEFSVYRDGRFYRDKLSESELLDGQDLDSLNEMNEVSKERFDSKGFSVSRV